MAWKETFLEPNPLTSPRSSSARQVRVPERHKRHLDARPQMGPRRARRAKDFQSCFSNERAQRALQFYRLVSLSIEPERGATTVFAGKPPWQGIKGNLSN